MNWQEPAEQLPLGTRVRIMRLRRGLTQEVLAGLVGRTTDWLSKVENGRIELDRLSVLRDLANALSVPVSRLLPEATVTEQHSDLAGRIAAALAQRDIRFPGGRLIEVDQEPQDTERVKARLDAVWTDSQNGRFIRVARELPFLIADAGLLASSARSSASQREADSILAMACNAAEFSLSKLGDPKMAWVAAERGLAAAERSDDPVLAGALARSLGHALLSNGAHAEAAGLLRRAGDDLLMSASVVAGAHGAQRLWSVYGTMHLAASMAEARLGNRKAVLESLEQAERGLDVVRQDRNHLYTSFGPTNVRIHHVSTAMELGDIHIGAEVGPTIDTRALPIERRVRHALETARANQLLGRQQRAAAILISSWKLAPEQVENHFLAKRVATLLLTGKWRPSASLTLLSERMGLV